MTRRRFDLIKNLFTKANRSNLSGIAFHCVWRASASDAALIVPDSDDGDGHRRRHHPMICVAAELAAADDVDAIGYHWHSPRSHCSGSLADLILAQHNHYHLCVSRCDSTRRTLMVAINQLSTRSRQWRVMVAIVWKREKKSKKTQIMIGLSIGFYF